MSITNNDWEQQLVARIFWFIAGFFFALLLVH